MLMGLPSYGKDINELKINYFPLASQGGICLFKLCLFCQPQIDDLKYCIPRKSSKTTTSANYLHYAIFA
jgi:hypothetical protein